MKYKLILFDLDGTLIDTNQLVYESYRHAFQKVLGRSVTPEEIWPFNGRTLHDAFAYFAPGKEDELITAYRQFNLAHHDTMVTPYPEALETMALLKENGCKLAVVTSKVRIMAWRGLALFGMDRFIDFLVGMEDCPHHKPHPAPVLTALDIANTHPADALMIGDSPYDILCAKAAGVDGAAVAWTKFTPEEMEKAGMKYWITKYSELTPIIFPEAGRKLVNYAE